MFHKRHLYNTRTKVRISIIMHIFLFLFLKGTFPLNTCQLSSKMINYMRLFNLLHIVLVKQFPLRHSHINLDLHL